jgi:hypothetical protein
MAEMSAALASKGAGPPNTSWGIILVLALHQQQQQLCSSSSITHQHCVSTQDL